MIRKLFKLLLAILAIVILASMADWFVTKRKLASYCHEMAGGPPVAAARQKALDLGFRYIESGSDEGGRQKVLVTASGVMGRLVCELEHDGRKVTGATLNSRD